MKKIMFFIVFVVLLAGCSNHNKELEESISTAIQQNNTEEIDLNAFTDFTWNKAFIITPYTSQKSINEQLGFKFKDSSNIASRDDINLILFVENGKVIHFVKIPRYADLIADNDDGLTPLNSMIKIKKQ